MNFESWRRRCKEKLATLLRFQAPQPCTVRELRQTVHEGVTIKALIMSVNERLELPAYLLLPGTDRPSHTAVMAIHGHGEVEPCIGVRDDYHHQFALELARRGHTVLCPELRGFGVLSDLARGLDGYRLDYWQWGQHMAYSLVTDAFQKGHTLIGATVEDLLRWEGWLARERSVETVHAVGISYGGDLALTYPVFSSRVDRIFASGTLGSFVPIFSRGYNAPAHCIPGVLDWMDRADIAGLNAPRPICLHYGALDVPGPGNFSASYNETVVSSVEELRAIYAAAGASEHISLVVSEGRKHEMDIEALALFLNLLQQNR
jgi:dienelactone hydrolase